MLNVRASRTYSHMLERCFNSLDKNYYNYGERGITVDKEWINNPTAFFNWYKENWFEGGQVDRIDNDGPYSESNCRIVDAKTNNRNRIQISKNMKHLVKVRISLPGLMTTEIIAIHLKSYT